MLVVDLVVTALIMGMAWGTFMTFRPSGSNEQLFEVNATLSLKSYIPPSIVLSVLLYAELNLAALAFTSYMCVCIAALSRR